MCELNKTFKNCKLFLKPVYLAFFCVKFDIIVAVTMKNIIFYNSTPYSLLEICRRLGRASLLPYTFRAQVYSLIYVVFFLRVQN
jgi:hypothetical protein